MEVFNMTDMEYEQMIEEAHAIPILDVASLVMNKYGVTKGKLTAECPLHTDNKLGNISFSKNRNIVKCFTCGTSWTTINIVKTCLNMDFKNAIGFLYDNFPNSFSQKPDFKGNGDSNFQKWDGLSNKEYSSLKISTRLQVNGSVMPISAFAKAYPTEHDTLLVAAIKNILLEIKELKKDFLRENQYTEEHKAKLDNDYIETSKKFINLLDKGLMIKENINIHKDNIREAIS